MSMPSHPQDDFDLLADWLDPHSAQVIELGCGAARLARRLLLAYPGCRVTGLEVDVRQHAKNLAEPAERLSFVSAGAEAIPFAADSFDLALMLKSLHHVPLADMDRALDEIRRVLRPGGHLYVSEPVYDGALNEIVRLFNDEREVRAAAQAALDRAIARGRFEPVRARHFAVPQHFADVEAFERRMLDVTFAERHLDATLRDTVRRRFASHMGDGGAHFEQPMHARLLRAR